MVWGGDMTTITLSTTPRGNGYRATVTFPDGFSMNSAETYSTIAEAMAAAALKVLDVPERLESLDCRFPPTTGPAARVFPPRIDPCSNLSPSATGGIGVIVTELLRIIRRSRYRQQFSIREIARRTGLSRNTVRKHLRTMPLVRHPPAPSATFAASPKASRRSASVSV
jgi:hypothetical protein